MELREAFRLLSQKLLEEWCRRLKNMKLIELNDRPIFLLYLKEECEISRSFDGCNLFQFKI